MAESKPPTIADVARHAGVSKGLVSFVFNDRPGVAPDTRARIVASAAELGWRPSVRGRSLSTRRSYALGLVVRRDPQVIAADPFFPAFISGVETALSNETQVLVLSVVADEPSELRTYETLTADRRVDGVFLTDLRQGDQRLALFTRLGLPAVAVGRPDVDAGFPVVTLDDAPGVAASVEHLADLGHTRIAYVAGDLRMLHGLRRRDAFLAAMGRRGLDTDLVLDTDFSAAQGAAATRTLLDRALRPTDGPPTAIVYASDPMALAGMGVAHQRGLRIPADLSITGFDGIEVGRYVHPTLTSVVADPVAWGEATTRVLLGLIDAGHADDVELPAAHLVTGGSSGPPPSAP